MMYTSRCLTRNDSKIKMQFIMIFTNFSHLFSALLAGCNVIVYTINTHTQMRGRIHNMSLYDISIVDIPFTTLTHLTHLIRLSPTYRQCTQFTRHHSGWYHLRGQCWTPFIVRRIKRRAENQDSLIRYGNSKNCIFVSRIRMSNADR